MSNNRRVKAVRNIFDTGTGNLIVPVGAEGQVLFGYIVPNDGLPGFIPKDKNLMLRVDFSGNIFNIRWATDVEFVNGLQAILSLLYVGYRVTEVRQLSGIDMQFPGQLSQSVKLFFSSGIHLVLSDDRVTGTLRPSFFVDRIVDPIGVIETYKTFRVDITDPSVVFITDHYEWTLNNTAMTADELIFQRGALLKEGEHYTVVRNNVGTKIIFSSNLVFDVEPPVDYLVAVYKTVQ